MLLWIMSTIYLYCICLFILHTNEYVQVFSVSEKYNVYDLAIMVEDKIWW